MIMVDDPLIEALLDARARTEELVLDLDATRWTAALRWELAHLAWFQARWVLGAEEDGPYASAVPLHARGVPPPPPRHDLLGYVNDVLDRVLTRVAAARGARAPLVELAVCHEDAHTEALACARHAVGCPEPRWALRAVVTQMSPAGAWPGDADVPGGEYWLGALPGTPEVVLDDEKWAHPVPVRPFRIARAPVTNEEFARFVDDGGYGRRELWSEAGWTWRETVGASHPLHWVRRGDEWSCRRWDRVERLPAHHPVVHVSWYEAEAFCRWAKRRLPLEAEWELAASSHDKRPMPWGDAPQTRAHANLDARAGRTVDVAACPDGDSPYGCRQMLGNVWEWTASPFERFPGWSDGLSATRTARALATPHMVLRGGSWATRGRTLRTTWREPQPPGTREAFAGFRTCAP
jgi:iron(II)-dependent oxidoreductase